MFCDGRQKQVARVKLSAMTSGHIKRELITRLHSNMEKQRYPIIQCMKRSEYLQLCLPREGSAGPLRHLCDAGTHTVNKCFEQAKQSKLARETIYTRQIFSQQPAVSKSLNNTSDSNERNKQGRNYRGGIWVLKQPQKCF